jgi:hypothetical protein
MHSCSLDRHRRAPGARENGRGAWVKLMKGGMEKENGVARFEVAGSSWQVKLPPLAPAAADYFSGKRGQMVPGVTLVGTRGGGNGLTFIEGAKHTGQLGTFWEQRWQSDANVSTMQRQGILDASAIIVLPCNVNSM